MTKGSYSVGENNATNSRKDTSYKSFICALLIFLFICLIILLATIGWGQKHSRNYDSRIPPKQEDESQAEVLERKGSEPNNSFEKIIVEVPETTTMVHDLVSEKTETVGLISTTKKIDTTVLNDVETTVTAKIKRVTLKSTTKEISTTMLNDLVTTLAGKTETGGLKSTTREISTTELNDLVTTIAEKSENVGLKSTTAKEIFETTEKFVSAENDTIFENVEESTKSNFENVSETETFDPEILTEQQENTTDFGEQRLESKHEKLILAETTSDSTSTENIFETTILPPVIKESHYSTEKIFETSELPPKESNQINTTEQIFETTVSTKTKIKPNISVSSTTEVSIMESDAITEPMSLQMLTKSSNPVCESTICKATASRILSMMNHSSDPCDDFYEFACGRFYQIEEESDEFRDVEMLTNHLNLIKDSSPKYLRDFKRFYQSCIQHEDYFNYRTRMNKLEDLLEQVGQFQFDDDESTVDLTELVAQLLLRQSMPLFDIGLDVDKHSSNLILQLTLPQQSFLRTGLDNWSGLSLLKKRCLKKQKSFIFGTHINLNEIYKSYQTCCHNYATYLNSIEFLMRELTAFQNLTTENLFKEIVATRQNIEFEVLNNLDSLPSTAEILSQFVQKKYEVRKLSDLKYHFPIFDWPKLFQIVTGREVTENTVIQLYFSNYFKKIFTSLAKVDKKKLNNALLAIYAYDLFINTVIPKQKFAREQFCTDLSKQLLPDVWSQFVQNSIPVKEQQKQNTRLGNIFGVLKKNFCKSLLVAEWIDDDTKTAIVNKCNNLNLMFFTPLDEASLGRNYENFNISTNFQKNLIDTLIHFKQVIYSLESTTVSPKIIFSHFLDPLSSKLLTFYSNSLIAAPLGLITKAPDGLPNYLIMTRVGLPLARQMARHFDPTGMTYGIKLKSFSKSTYSELVETMRNLMDYSSPRLFEGKNISFSFNGSLSVTERIVDNTAFRLIFDSLSLNPDDDILPWISAQFSREKVFFIATAQEFCKKTSILDFMLQVLEKRHLPAALRVENIMGNSEDFANKFTCPDGSGIDFYVKLQFPYLSKVDEEYIEEEDMQQT